jgi:hypothetical protein
MEVLGLKPDSTHLRTNLCCFYRGAKALLGPKTPHEVSRSHSDTPHSVRLLRTRDGPALLGLKTPHEVSKSHSDTPHSVRLLWTRDGPALLGPKDRKGVA